MIISKEMTGRLLPAVVCILSLILARTEASELYFSVALSESPIESTEI